VWLRHVCTQLCINLHNLAEDLGGAIDVDGVEVFLRSSIGDVLLHVGNVSHEAETVLRRVGRTKQAVLNLHLSDCKRQRKHDTKSLSESSMLLWQVHQHQNRRSTEKAITSMRELKCASF